MEIASKEEYRHDYTITIKHPSFEVLSGFGGVPTKIRFAIGTFSATSQSSPYLNGGCSTWNECLVVTGIARNNRSMMVELLLEGEVRYLSATTHISFAAYRKQILVGDEFFRGYIRLRIEAIKCPVREASEHSVTGLLLSNMRLQLSEQVIDEIEEDEVEYLPLETLTSTMVPCEEYPAPKITISRSSYVLENIPVEYIRSDRHVRFEHVYPTEKYYYYAESEPPIPISIDTPLHSFDPKLCPVEFAFSMHDDEFMLLGLEKFEYQWDRFQTVSLASQLVQYPIELPKVPDACYSTNEMCTMSMPTAIQTERSPREEYTSWLMTINDRCHAMFTDSDSEESDPEMDQSVSLMDCHQAIHYQPQSSEEERSEYTWKNSYSIEYSLRKVESMAAQPSIDSPARSVKYIEKWPELFDANSDEDREIYRLVRLELANLRCRVVNMQIDEGKCSVKMSYPTVVKSSLHTGVAKRYGQTGSQVHDQSPPSPGTCIEKEDYAVTRSISKQVRMANLPQKAAVADTYAAKYEPLTEFARSLRSAFGDSTVCIYLEIYENKSATTLQKSVLCYSVPKASRFLKPRLQEAGSTYFTGSCFQNSKAKGTSFGYGNRKAYPLWLERNMKYNPAPNYYQEVQSSSPQLPKGFSFGLSYHYYQKATIFYAEQPKRSPAMPSIKHPRAKSRRDIYAALGKPSTSSGSNYHFKSQEQLTKPSSLLR